MFVLSLGHLYAAQMWNLLKDNDLVKSKVINLFATHKNYIIWYRTGF